jgi:hypothetical protein
MQRLPGIARHHQAYLPVYPLAFECFDLRGHDMIVSSSSAWAKAVRAPAGVPHLCYCHTPMRFAWNYDNYIQGESVSRATTLLLRPAMALLRRYDVATSGRVTRFVANSRAVSARIARYYRRDSVVIHPPVATDRFQIASDVGDSFLIAQRLAPYKRLDVAIDAFNMLGLPLTIVGDGRARAELERRAGPTIQFAGRLSDEQLAELRAGAREHAVDAADPPPNLIRRDQIGAKGAREVLAGRWAHVDGHRLALSLTAGQIIEHAIAGDGLSCRVECRIANGLADDTGHFAFVVHLLLARRVPGGHTVSEKAGWIGIVVGGNLIPFGDHEIEAALNVAIPPTWTSAKREAADIRCTRLLPSA